MIKNREDWDKKLEYWSKDSFLDKQKRRLEKRGSGDIYRRNSYYARALKYKITPTEKIFGNFLSDCEIPFMFQKGFVKPFHRIVDFYIPSLRLIVEIDGGYHRNIVGKDRLKDKLWNRFGTLRILNSQIEDGSYKEIFKKWK